ncbi:MAG TPA: sensor histidine kinase [Candidatus Erysipelatoclostridium merdavium]|uniref:histidine kinase n=1 Tax=Candidatus Erysipelatoclostridium merdavium TaxID=2838566 RepID=A0A9D1XK72_9FIRM|nr:sensor histidine kinase [Candidatus Erysipelatoclostridium merdavium]
MKLLDYIKDQIVLILLYFTMILLVQFFLVMYHLPATLKVSLLIIMVLFLLIVISYDYYRKSFFYQDFQKNLDQLDKKCLISALITRPNFLEGQILYDSLYEIDKATYEEIEKYQQEVSDFKEYIELWIHEVKLPIASTKLMIHNHESNVRKLKDQINKIENNVELVLYYARLDSSEKDYLIKKCDLNQIIKNVIKKNQDSLLYQNIAIKIKNIEATVLSDSKWLEFIINQIISNSIKYHGESDCLISFNVIQNENYISLEILDNGIGIKDSELPYVFDKSFTGENGRLVSSATGMGLYIVKNLCHKLGHQIAIESKQWKYTKVIIDFNNEDYYKVVR